MALLGTIRNRFGWVMMGLIFVGIGSFLFMDASGPGSKLGNSSSKVGSVNGEKITRDQLSEASRNLQGQGMLQQEVDKNVWDNIVVEKLINQKSLEAGFDVTADEMGELFLSEDPRIQSSLVAQQFRNPQTGQIDYERIRQALTTFKSRGAITTQYEGDQRQQLLDQYDVWKDLEKSVYNRRLQNKYFNALDIGFYTPDWMVETENNIRYASYSFDYTSIPYTAIEGEGDVTEGEIKDYIKAHPRQYKREATVSVDYITFDVIPTAADSSAIYKEMEATADEFRKEKDDTLFVDSRDGEFAADYYTRDELTVLESLKDSMLSAADGTVFGPFLQDNQYKVVKTVASKTLPDSVKARHILVRGTTQQELIAGRTLLDSLKKVLEEDATASFDSLAAKFSQDGSASKGGDLGWKAKDGTFVAQFEEHMFYSGKKDSLKIIFTQFGAHLIQITGNKFETNKKGVRIAVIAQNIVPSDKTVRAVKSKVNDFIITNNSSDKMRAAAQEKGMQVGSASGLKADDYEIAGLGKNSAAASIIDWAHEEGSKVNMVNTSLLGIDNEALNYTKQYVVASLTNKTPKGLASANDPIVKAEVDRILRNKKKAALVDKKLNEVNTLDGIAGAYGVSVRTANAVQYNNADISPATSEPKVVALAAATATGKVSKAIAGNEGVYVVRTTNKTEAATIADIKTTRQSINRVVTGAVSSKILDDMKEDADIVDSRND
jgi:peptidyl-prolyl cis-trans isomerase D